MRTVTVEGHVGAPPNAVLDALDPATIVDAEGTFSPVETREKETGIDVIARGGGMEVAFTFLETEDGYEYEQHGGAGPFETMRTTLSIAPEDAGSTIILESTVALGLPLSAITDRIAAWKRRGELRRALAAIDEAV